MAPFLVAATMIGLFEGTLVVLRWTGRDSLAPNPDAWASARPYVWPLAAVAGYAVSSAPVPAGLYGRLPTPVTDGGVQLGVGGATPVVVGGRVLLAFEAVAWLARRSEASRRTRRTLARVRLPVWLTASVVGYLASPDPVALRVARDADVAATTAVALALGLVVVYEGTIAVSRYVRRGE
jgi:sec-independent protein translocase protein TatC